jgi:4-hydroxybenzoate polyprenyltransferase
MNRWFVYQRERFPLAGHAPLVAAFSASAVCFSSLLRGRAAMPPARVLIVAFLTSLLFFLQLRIADEFKDAEDDARFRPYRPVPRGLVTLGELAWIGIGAAAVQFALALWLKPSLVWLLLLPWAYLALMTREFFVGRWLKAHPIIYMTSHMVILPLVDLYATACDWRAAGLSEPPAGLAWFLTVSYLNGIVIEIGRKTRVPADEEHGVDTYSALWGSQRAARAWIASIVVTAAAAWQASARIGTQALTLALLSVLTIVSVAVVHRFVHHPASGRGKTIEAMAGIWTVLMYVGLGAGPVAIRLWRAA